MQSPRLSLSLGKSLCLLLACISSVARAGEVFVSPSGKDDAAGTKAAPFKTVGRALKGASAGDTITLRAGRYAGGVRITKPRITLQGHPGERAIIASPPKGKGPHAALSIARGGDGVVIRNLEIGGGTMHAVDFEAANCVIEDCVCHDTGADVIKCSPSSSKITIRRCEIYNSAGGAKYGWKSNAEGIDNVRSDDMLVQDCFIHDTATNGVYAKGGARRAIIERCLFMRIGLDRSVQGQGVILGEHAGGTKTYENFDSTVRNCIFIDISGAGVALWCADGPKVYNNTMVNVAKTDRAGIIILQNHDRPTRNATIVNNIVAVARGSKKAWVWIYPNGHAGKLTMDRNVYFGGAGKFVDSRKGWKEYRTIAAWSEATGCDAGSVICDPGVDLKTGHLKPGSPCIDGGKTLKEVADDYDGAKRKGKLDIGADEFKAGVPLPVPPAKGTVGTRPKKMPRNGK